MKTFALMWGAFSTMAWATGVPWYFAPVTGLVTVGVMEFFFRAEEVREQHKHKHGGSK